MLFGITGFEIRYQLRNPVFWVSVAIFFLLGFGLTASENVSVGTPGAVHENAPFAIAVATAIMSLFYLFVITAFVANAIVRDETSGFAPIVRATSVTNSQIVIGRFLGGLLIAWLGYLSVPIGMWAGSIMPWVDAETIGPQKLSYYAWNFAIFGLPNILLMSAVLFALGVAGFLFRRNIITVFMSIELMLNAVNLSFVTFSYQLKKVDGHLFTFFVMVVAAAEAAVGLAIILTVFKNRNTLNADDVNSMKL